MQEGAMLRITKSCLAGLVVWLCAASADAVPAPQDVVMYEVNLRAFSQAGNLAGVSARLDDIQSLGANVLWLMPIHPIGQVNSVGQLGSPYSVQDYGAVSSEYGTLSDLTSLINAAHDRDMYVLLDWVANHTAWDHAWMATPDWYTQNEQGEVIHPPGTNWLDVADLNYSNATMRSAMISEMQYWVTDVGIDGFRADAADLVPFSFWQQAIPAVRSATERPLLMLAEGARTNHFNAGFDLTFGWNFFGTVQSVFNSSSSATSLNASRSAIYSQVPQGKSILQFTTNHDETAWNEPPPELFGSLEASLAAFAATVVYGGTPLVYNGQEIGWEDNVPFFSKSPIDWNTGQDTAEWYSQFLGIRQDHAALRSGTFNDQSNSDVAMVLREYQGEQVLVMINTRDSASQIQVPVAWQGEWIDQFSENVEILAAMRTLAPYEVLILAAAPSSVLGDYNDDGFVNAADYTVWRDTLEAAGTSLPNDSTPGTVDESDFLYWRAHFGETIGGGSGQVVGPSIPEPGTIPLLVAACGTAALARCCVPRLKFRRLSRRGCR